MNAPEVHYVPPKYRHGYIVQDAYWFVARHGWGRRFTSRQAALDYADTLWETPMTRLRTLLARLRGLCRTCGGHGTLIRGHHGLVECHTCGGLGRRLPSGEMWPR